MCTSLQVVQGPCLDCVAGVVIPGSGTLYLSPNVLAFRARNSGPGGGQGLFVQGTYSPLLSGGYTLRIVDTAGNTVASTP